MAIVIRQVIERSPEKREDMPMIIRCLVRPSLWQRLTHLATLERPDLSVVARLPAAQIFTDYRIVDTGLFRQFSQSGLGGCFSALNGSFY
ncbi:hypothetical protein AYO71_13895 [Pseudomonas koreensis]|nr:hypothetical protein AYO71_13895 [Pseudomonas koreensis]